MIIVLAVICGLQLAAAVTVLLLVLRHVAARDQQHAQERRETLAQHRAEIADLLQRIQAPEVAVYQHDPAPDPTGQTFPLDDEALAKQQDQERAHALAQVQEMEAEMAVL